MSAGYLSVEMLSFLRDQPWDDVARAYVTALRPSEVRVSTGELKSDAKPWRVTVIVDAAERITEISQEVEVELPPGIENGHALACELATRGVY